MFKLQNIVKQRSMSQIAETLSFITSTQNMEKNDEENKLPFLWCIRAVIIAVNSSNKYSPWMNI